MTSILSSAVLVALYFRFSTLKARRLSHHFLRGWMWYVSSIYPMVTYAGRTKFITFFGGGREGKFGEKYRRSHVNVWWSRIHNEAVDRFSDTRFTNEKKGISIVTLPATLHGSEWRWQLPRLASTTIRVIRVIFQIHGQDACTICTRFLSIFARCWFWHVLTISM